jgi:hypothetical protein
VELRLLGQPIGKQLVDQSAHFAAGGFVALLVGLPLDCQLPNAAGLLIGLSLGVVREVTEPGKWYSRNSLLDIAFWGLGGLTAALFS